MRRSFLSVSQDQNIATGGLRKFELVGNVESAKQQARACTGGGD